MFKGLSTLRAAEQKTAPVSEKSKALQAYLAAQYGGGDGAGEPEKKKKKKKKREAPGPGGPGIKILDQDVSGFAAVPAGGAAAARRALLERGGPQLHDDADEEEDEDQPVVVNAEEAERLKLLAEREKKFYQKGDDGSGWAVTEEGAAARRDASPPRRQRHDSPDASPPRRQRHDSPDASPPRRQRHDSPDASPPRRRAAAADASPPRRQRHDSPDASPPRRRAAAAEADASPPRRQRHDSPDASPPRRGRHDSSDASPPRRQRHDSPDASPPRRRRPSSDASPPRRRQPDSRDASPPRWQRGAVDAAADASPPRKRQGEDGEGAADEGAEAKRRRMMSDGTVAGMVSGRELMEEMAKKREREKQRFAELEADVTGRGAQTVFRDREGRRVSKEEFLEQQAAAKKKAQYDSEAQLEWGGGLAQRAAAAQRAADMAAEAAKPFARSADDVELDVMHRRKTRWGDPMAGLVKTKLPEPEAPSTLVDAHAARLKKSGFIIPQEVPRHSWLRRGVGAPPNRYSIKPGRHWDGVDRGNGFEREMFKRQNELKRQAQEAYMWAQEDM